MWRRTRGGGVAMRIVGEGATSKAMDGHTRQEGGGRKGAKMQIREGKERKF